MLIQQSFTNENATLYLIGTPIGNMDDMTYRAVKTLEELEYLFCEDTRVTSKLVNHFNLKLKLTSYHEYNKEEVHETMLNLLERGNDIGVVSDAGMPVISDPGYDIVKIVKNHGYNVVVVPGPSAFLQALCYSSFETTKFTYFGFLNKKSSKKIEEIKSIIDSQTTTAVYESKHKLLNTLKTISEVDDEINIQVSRELTKKFEEHITGKPSEVLNHFEQKVVKGEYVIIFEKKIINESIKDPIDAVEKLISSGESQKDAIKIVAKKMKVNKNDIYKLFVKGE